MKKRDLLLTGTLMVLIGVLIGLIITTVNPGFLGNDFAEVRVTEVRRSAEPFFKPEDLERIDTRFLFQKIAHDVTNTVVYIETTVQMQDRQMDGEPGDNGIWDRFMPKRARTVGSGVIISADGYVLTNNHVIEGSVGDGIHITLNDKRSFPARIVGADSSTDLAVLKINADNLETAVLGNSDSVGVGEWVLAVGNPFRLRSTVTAGIVSALSRDVQIINDAMRIESFIQTDAAINRGNSGGALVNTSGELIGINTAIATQSGNYQGYGFAVPSNLALKVAGDLIEFGEIRRGMLGVTIESVSHPIARDLDMDRIRGVLIVNAPPEGAAYESGIRRNDIIIEVDGDEVNEANQLQEKVAMYRPGDLVKLTILRNGETIVKEVSLSELAVPEQPEILEFDEDPVEPEGSFRDRPEEPDMEQQGFYLGFTIREITDPTGQEQAELVVDSVQRESEAWNRGLRQGYRVLEIDDKPVSSLSEFNGAIEKRLAETGSVTLTTRTPESVTAYFILSN
ncbi:MAG: trypsin-like peptidase domain-containing protein [Balneolaceae bacterium]